MNRCIVFDLDGTLIDSRQDLVNTCNMLRASYDLEPLPGEQIAAFIGDGIQKLLERTLSDSSVSPAEAMPRMLELYAQNLNRCTVLYPGVFQGIRRLAECGWHIALFSNKKEMFCERTLEYFALAEYFTVVIGDSDRFARKPDPEALNFILKKLQIVDPGESWMVGDHHTDLEAGKKAGMKTAFCSYGIGDPGVFQPDLTVDHFAELVRRLSDA